MKRRAPWLWQRGGVPKWAKYAQALLLPWKGAVGIWQQAEWVMIAQNCLKEASKKRVEGGGNKGLDGRNKDRLVL